MISKINFFFLPLFTFSETMPFTAHNPLSRCLSSLWRSGCRAAPWPGFPSVGEPCSIPTSTEGAWCVFSDPPIPALGRFPRTVCLLGGQGVFAVAFLKRVFVLFRQKSDHRAQTRPREGCITHTRYAQPRRMRLEIRGCFFSPAHTLWDGRSSALCAGSRSPLC